MDWGLSGRLNQEVVEEGHHSTKEKVLSGVPQGSVLGPCLFLHYINALPDGLTSRARLFADDTIVYLTINNTLDARQLEKWQMEFHPKICQVFSITNKKKTIVFDFLDTSACAGLCLCLDLLVIRTVAV